MINEEIFNELTTYLEKNNYEILNNEKTKNLYQFMYKSILVNIEKEKGYIFFDDNELLENTKKIYLQEIDGILKGVLKKLNIDYIIPIDYDFIENLEFIKNDTYYLILQYKNICLYMKDNCYLGISYHIFNKLLDNEIAIGYKYECENIAYNLEDAINIFLTRSKFNEIIDRTNKNSFSLAELSSIIYILSKADKVTDSHKKYLSSFIKKATNIIKLKNNTADFIKKGNL